MTEEWGLSLQYNMSEKGLVLSVKDIQEESPARHCLRPGDKILGINDWNIGQLKEPQIAANLFRAGGYFIRWTLTGKVRVLAPGHQRLEHRPAQGASDSG